MTVIPFPAPKPEPQEVFVERYTRDEAATMFKIPRRWVTTEAGKARAKEVNDTLDALASHTGIRDAELCRRVYIDEGEDYAMAMMYRYLTCAAGCPRKVTDEAERLIKLHHERELAKNLTP